MALIIDDTLTHRALLEFADEYEAPAEVLSPRENPQIDEGEARIWRANEHHFDCDVSACSRGLPPFGQ